MRLNRFKSAYVEKVDFFSEMKFCDYWKKMSG